MAVGKNKRLSKSKKGSKKKVVDPFTKKEWYDIKAPSMFEVKDVGKTLCTKTIGTKLAEDSLKGRVYEVSLADLQNDEDRSFRKIRLRCDDVQGKKCLTNFHGMTFTTDKIRSLVRKWQTLIEANVDVKTLDGYTLRLFCIGFTQRNPYQLKKACYTKTAKIKAIRKKMVEIMLSEASGVNLKDLVQKFIPEAIGESIRKACQRIFPVQNIYVWKAKIVRFPRFDLSSLMAVHEADEEEDMGEKIERIEGEDAMIEEADDEDKGERGEWGDS